MRRRGFTLIEVLVVISIIAVLAALLVIGVGKLQTTAKRRQTEQVLANAQAIFADFEATTAHPFGSGVPGVATIACPQNVTLAVDPQLTYLSNGRIGDAVLATRDYMYALLQTQNNHAAIAKFPANELMVIPSSYAIGATNIYNPATTYQIGNKVAVANGDGTQSYFRRTALVPPVAADGATGQADNGSQTPPNPSFWLVAPPPNVSGALSQLAYTTPVLLDGWGDPIIFVPCGILGNVATGTSYPGGTITSGGLVVGSQYFQVTSPGTAAPGGIAKPFFASAGPDGDFSKGDDNLYSFEH